MIDSRVLEKIKQDADRRRKEDERELPQLAFDLIRQEKLGAIRLKKGVTIEQVFEMVMALAAVDPDVSHALRYHFYAVELYLLNPAQYQAILARVAEGELVGNAFVEQNGKSAGSYQFDMTLIPVCDARGEGYTLSGTKYFCTGTLYAQWVEVLATLDGQTVRMILPTDRAGIQVKDDWDGMGQKLTGSGTTVFTDVFVHKHELIPMSNATPFKGHLQLYLQAVIAGIVQNIEQDVHHLISGRTRTFSFAAAPVPKEDPQLLQVAGEIASAAWACQQLILEAARSLDRVIDTATGGVIDYETTHQASLACAKAKVIVDKLALDAANALFEVGSASAAVRTAYLDRHWRNIRTISSHNPTVYKARALGDYSVNEKKLPLDEQYF